MFFILALPLRRFLGKPSEVSNNNPNHGLQIHGDGVTTSFGNCTPEERQAYLMELDEILCGEN